MANAAIYARYSTYLQRPASIEDQTGRSLQVAMRLGFTVPPELVFSDSAVSGVAKAADKRLGWQALMQAWDEGQFEAIFVDEISRIARDQLDLARIQRKVKETGVRLVTADGLDSSQPLFALTYGIASALAAHELDEIRFRVQRGMEGQLKRGFMIAAPPYAYTRYRYALEDGTELGTRWTIDTVKAETVRSIYKDRLGGQSLASIALRLNTEGLPTSRTSRRNPGEPGKWLPGTVFQLLGNSIYRGIMTWNGSGFARTRARRENRALQPIPYAFPELRIVDDEVWDAVNKRSARAIAKGGTRSVFSGLVTCGSCNGTLCLSTGGSRDSFCCHNCMSRHRVGAQEGHPGYFTKHALELAVNSALEAAIDESGLELFRARLVDRMNHGAAEELDQLQKELESTVRRGERLLDLVEAVGKDAEPDLVQRYKAAMEAKSRIQMRRDRLAQQCAMVSQEALKGQLMADPRPLVKRIFDGSLQDSQVRSMLAVVCPRIVYLGKPRRFSHEFRVDVVTGEIVAQAMSGEPIDRVVATHFVRVNSGPERPTPWSVEEIEVPTGRYVAVGVESAEDH